MSRLRQRHSDAYVTDEIPLLNPRDASARQRQPFFPARAPTRSVGRQLCCKCLGLLVVCMLTAGFFLVYYTVASWRHRFSYLDPSAAKLQRLPASYVKRFEARCLDGSSPAYFITENDPRRWVIYFGAAPLYWCIDAEDCALRIDNSAHATTVGLPDALSLHHDGVLSSNSLANAEFWNWTKVVVHQCDGASFLGARPTPYTDAAGRLLYSRGHFIGLAVATHLAEQRGMAAAEHVLFVGVAGSGVGLMTMAASLEKLVKAESAPRFLLDSGYLLDLPSFHNEALFVARLQSLFEFHGLAHAPGLAACFKAVPNPDNRWRCLLPKTSQSHFNAPLFVAQSAYDPWTVSHVLGIDCTVHGCANNEAQLTRVHGLRRDFLLALRKITSSEVDGLWLNACWTERHVTNQALYTRVRVEQRNLQQALADWLHERQPHRVGHTYMDGIYPSNPTCPLA